MFRHLGFVQYVKGCILFVLMSLPAFPQRSGANPSVPTHNIELVVKVAFPNERPVERQTRVELLNIPGVPVDEGFTDSQGEAHLRNVRPGAYRLRVTSVDTEEMVTVSTFNIYREESIHYEQVYVKPRQSKEQSSTQGSVSTAALNIPDKARNEVEKGAAAMDKEQWEEARQHLSRAVEIYPAYAEALNGLGVIAMKSGSRDEGRKYFEKAIAVDSSFAPSYVNMAKLYVLESNFAKVEELLNKAVALSPMSSESLSMLAYSQFSLKKYDLAVLTVKRVHDLPHQNFAVAHIVSARAQEKLGQPVEAAAEYETYLRESPNGPSAEQARAALRVLQARLK